MSVVLSRIIRVSRDCTTRTSTQLLLTKAAKRYTWADQHIRCFRMASAAGPPVVINDTPYRIVREGRASILAPYQVSSSDSKKESAQAGNPRNNDEGNQAVFYNPIQQYNRDLSVLAILVYGEGAVEEKRSRKQQRKPRKGANKKNHLLSRDTSETGQDGSKKRKASESDLDEESAKRLRTAPQEQNGEQEPLVQAGSKQNSDAIIQQPPQPQQPTTSEGDSTQARQVPFTILDALSASGLRAVRYAKEIPFATTIVANDLLPEATKAIDLNIEHNDLKGKVFSHVGDAKQFMYSKCGNESIGSQPSYVHRFDVIDLDPYGTAAPFLDAAIQSVVDGGLLCVTCTDAGVWASNGYPEKAFALYSGVPLKGVHSHEAGLRLILHSISLTAAKYGIAIEPLLSLSIDFYARLFVRVHKSQQEVKLLAGTTMFVYNCDQGCGAWQTQLMARNSERRAKNGDPIFKHGFSQGPTATPFCAHCGSKTHLGGPMWAGPLHNPVFVQKIIDKLPDLDKTVYGTTDRIQGMLTVALEEEHLDWQPDLKQVPVSKSKQVNGVEEETLLLAEKKVSAVIPRLPPSLLSPSPFFFIPTYLAKVLSLSTPGDDALRGAFLGLGYSCTRSHCKPGSFKTNAPWSVVWEVMREYARCKETSRLPRLFGEGEFEGRGSVRKGSPGWTILRRLRGRDDGRFLAAKVKETLRKRLTDGGPTPDVETMTDLRELITSTLYELEHPKAEEAVPVVETIANGENGESPQTASAAAATKSTSADLSQAVKISGKALIEAGGDVSELVVTFDEELGKSFRNLSGKKIVRYQINPRANWGPMVKAGTGA